MIVQVADPDTSRDPHGDQLMVVTGLWPGYVRTLAALEEGLCQNIYNRY